jgi:alkaline phosphatase D
MKFTVILFLLIAHCDIVFSQEQVKIAFGSCSHQNDSLFILNDVVAHTPDFFVFLGDNIYADTRNKDTLKSKYDFLAKKSAYKNLKSSTKILATWDDHDYGMDDVGKYFELKKESKELFLKFFEEPKLSMRRFREGIYTSYIYQFRQKDNSIKKLQFLILDERTFRSDLKIYDRKSDTIYKGNPAFFYHMDYLPIEDTDSTILGQEQWLWLEDELKKEADFRIICSGTQFGVTYNSYESWANFPHEQKKMLDLIQKTKAENLVFISGDSHYSEISKFSVENHYPIFDITSSGLTEKVNFATSNLNRIEGPVLDNNFGLLTVNWALDQVKMEIWDEFQNQRIEYTFSLEELKFMK